MPPQQRKRLLEFVNEITDLGTHGYSPEIRLSAAAFPDLPTLLVGRCRLLDRRNCEARNLGPEGWSVKPARAGS